MFCLCFKFSLRLSLFDMSKCFGLMSSMQNWLMLIWYSCFYFMNALYLHASLIQLDFNSEMHYVFMATWYSKMYMHYALGLHGYQNWWLVSSLENEFKGKITFLFSVYASHFSLWCPHVSSFTSQMHYISVFIW